MKLLMLIIAAAFVVIVSSKSVKYTELHELPRSEWDMGISHIFKGLSKKTMNIKQKICGMTLLTAASEVCDRGYNLKKSTKSNGFENDHQVLCCKRGCTLNEVKEYFCV
uniref:IlGF domain-containing protein n=1 Tax=Steinernema glaseri TaxID=37863 RepID=A0A1I7Y2Q2_9BILA